jgi:hypothetical protein
MFAWLEDDDAEIDADPVTTAELGEHGERILEV